MLGPLKVDEMIWCDQFLREDGSLGMAANSVIPRLLFFVDMRLGSQLNIAGSVPPKFSYVT